MNSSRPAGRGHIAWAIAALAMAGVSVSCGSNTTVDAGAPLDPSILCAPELSAAARAPKSKDEALQRAPTTSGAPNPVPAALAPGPPNPDVEATAPLSRVAEGEPSPQGQPAPDNGGQHPSVVPFDDRGDEKQVQLVKADVVGILTALAARQAEPASQEERRAAMAETLNRLRATVGDVWATPAIPEALERERHTFCQGATVEGTSGVSDASIQLLEWQGVEASSDAAQANFLGAWETVPNSTGKRTVDCPVQFQFQLMREKAGWRLVSWQMASDPSGKSCAQGVG